MSIIVTNNTEKKPIKNRLFYLELFIFNLLNSLYSSGHSSFISSSLKSKDIFISTSKYSSSIYGISNVFNAKFFNIHYF